MIVLSTALIRIAIIFAFAYLVGAKEYAAGMAMFLLLFIPLKVSEK